ncbi:fucolectin-related protein, partial [Biomphalaria glabrata]
MIKLNEAIFVLLACISFVLISSVAAKKCEEGWFGPECQYKCRCQQSCNPEGECPDKCEDGWFGYKCQYILDEYKATTNLSDEDVTHILTDENENTCINIEAEAVLIDLESLYYKPWIRLITQNPEGLHGLNLSYFKEDRKPVVALWKYEALIRDNTVDIHIPTHGFISSILLESKESLSICSLWFIVGQNAAIKQKVYYSNSIINQIDTDLPQYPPASDGVATCNKNDTRYGGTNWKIVMEPSYVIKRFKLFVNDTR